MPYSGFFTSIRVFCGYRCWSSLGKFARIRRFSSVVDWTYACVMSRNHITAPFFFIRAGPKANNSRWLIRWMVGDCVSIIAFPSSLYAWITSLDFSYGCCVVFPLTSLTMRELKIRFPVCFARSYYIMLKTLLTIRLSILTRVDSWNGAPVVVILPSRRSVNTSSQSAFSFAVVKISATSIPVTNCSSDCSCCAMRSLWR